MFPFFKKKPKPAELKELEPLYTDMHSHVLPGLDDGSPDIPTSIELVRELSKLGYKKLICTPHVMSDFYKNTPESISEAALQLKTALKDAGITMQIEIAAEYYLDEIFMERIEKQEQLLNFGDKYVLFETSFMNPSVLLNNAVFFMQSQGYRTVLAHPERYVYLYGKYNKLEELHEKGVHLQININSLTGYYSREAKKVAEKLIDDKLVSFIGTDCHHARHIEKLNQAHEGMYYRAALELPLLNRKL
jgi:tyrosine-protein phosphatase YwqE